MKKYKIVLLPSAKQDLINMGEYLSQYYQSTAVKRFDKIEKNISLLEDYPFMCEEYACAFSDLKFRKMVVDEYLIFYVINDNVVEIHAIVNGKTDFLSSLM